MRVLYRSNNSGGSWWLSDEDWRALERAGWYVEWGGLWFCGYASEPRPWIVEPPVSLPPRCSGECQGHRVRNRAEDVSKRLRHLEALATSAWLEVDSAGEAVRSWEAATGKSATSQGCSCCGPPHTFSWVDDSGDRHYAAGNDLWESLVTDPFEYEAYKRLKKKYG